MIFKIVTPTHTSFAAGILSEQLHKLGHSAKIVHEIDVRDPDVYIIYNASGYTRLPKQYIVMQTEIGTSHWFTTRYLKTIKNALAVWDYSELNTVRYNRINNKIAIVTPGIKWIEHNGKDIEYLFYGWIQGSKRRDEIVNHLREVLNVTVVENTVGEQMWDFLKRTKVVINIHYYENSPLELYRLHESISHGCKVWLQDEGYFYENAKDNLEEIKEGLKMAGINAV